MEISGKTAIVTGAASGIGLGIATALAEPMSGNWQLGEIYRHGRQGALRAHAKDPERVGTLGDLGG